MKLLIILGSIFFSYLFGSIPNGIIIGKLFKNIDVREYGSNSSGAANVTRVIGKKAGMITMFLDLFKGGLAPLICFYITKLIYLKANFDYTYLAVICYTLGSLFVCLGHCFPILAHFKGGKAVSCVFGIYISKNPHLAFFTLIIYILVRKLANIVSLASIIVVLVSPILCLFPFFFKPYIFNFYNLDNSFSKIFYILLIPLLSILVIIRHIPNIKRMIKGNENKIKEKKA